MTGFTALAANDVLEIRTQIEAYVKAARENDLETFGRIMADDFIEFIPGQPPRGREATLEMMKSVRFTGFSVNIDEIDGEKNLAYARGTYKMSMKGPDGPEVEDHGKWLQIHRRQPDGRWLYTRLLFHSDSALPANSFEPPK